MNPLFHLDQEPETDTLTNQKVYSLLLLADVLALHGFYDDVQQWAKLTHNKTIAPVKGMMPMRKEVATALETAGRNKRLVEVSVEWQHIRHRQLAKTQCEIYLQFLDAMANNGRANHSFDLVMYRQKYQPAFERIIQTIDQTRS